MISGVYVQRLFARLRSVRPHRPAALRHQRLGLRVLLDGVAAARRRLQHSDQILPALVTGLVCGVAFVLLGAPFRLHEGRSPDRLLRRRAAGHLPERRHLRGRARRQLLHPRRPHLGGGHRTHVRAGSPAGRPRRLPHLPRLGALPRHGRATRRPSARGRHRRRQRRHPAGQRHGPRPVLQVAARGPGRRRPLQASPPAQRRPGGRLDRTTWRRSPTGTTPARSSSRCRAPRPTWSASSTRVPAGPRSTSRCCPASTT